jgi:RDD family
VYIAPDGSFSATYPSILRRIGAGAVDWVLCWVVYLIASIVGGIVQGVGETSLDAGGAGTPLGVALVVL